MERAGFDMPEILVDKSEAKGCGEGMSDVPKFFLWSKIGTESGESLQVIIRRKEIERKACDGVFFWGVGNSVRLSLSILRQLSKTSSAVFSEMRSKPKVVDIEPSRLLLWLAYEDEAGNRHPLPPHSFVTSRGMDDGHGSNRAHYALVCRTDSAIDEDTVGELDATALVNIRSGRPVGYSQVTSVVAINGSAASKPMHYPVTFTATLIGPGQVRLTDCIEISANDVAVVTESAERRNLAAWKRAVADTKRKLVGMSQPLDKATALPAQLDMLETI